MEPNNSGYNMNEASIVDLKAELYKKELEAKKKGIGSTTQYVLHKKSKTLQKIARNTGKFKKQIEPTLKAAPILSDLESQKLKQVSNCLDAKSRLYDKLKQDAIQGSGHQNLSELGFMVDFEKKAALREPIINEPSFSEIVQSAEEEHREKMNVKWEQERQRLKEKPLGQEHYQDVFFNELREHGVGYYHFSSNEEERVKQLELLKNLRDQTLGARKKNTEIKAKREQAMSDRLMKIRKRRGLPAEQHPPKIEPMIDIVEEESATIDNQIEDMIQASKQQDLYESLTKKIQSLEKKDESEDIDEQFAPPTDYSIKSKHSRYYNRR